MSYPEKYDKLLDDEVWTFIEATDAYYPPDATERTIAEQRQVYNKLCRAFFTGYPDGVTAANSEFEEDDRTIPFRRYTCSSGEPEAEVIYFHGGGFVVGGLDSHDDICAEICAATGFTVTSVDYRLAPENTFPADFEDAVAAYHHVVRKTDLPIIIVGDSAGGNLAASVCHAVRRGDRAPAGQVLIYPGLSFDLTRPSFVEHSHAPALTTQDCEFYVDLRTGGNRSALLDRRCSPLADDDFSNLPPTLVVSAQCDPLRDDGHDYCKVLIAAGTKAHFIEEAGLIHGYLRARNSVAKARKSFDRIIQGIGLLGRSQWIDEPGET